MFAYGRGTSQQYTRAWSLFEKAAQLNHPEATYYLVSYKLRCVR